MKKLLLVSIMALGLGSVAMANEGTHLNKGSHRMTRTRKHSNCGETSKERQLMREGIKDNPKFDQWKIELQEIKVKLMKEMAKDSPDFTEVGRINREKAEVQAEIQTERMKMRYNIEKELEKNKSN